MWNNSNAPLTEGEERRAKTNANHGKRCSCDMCGNPRRGPRKELTMQEIKNDDRYTDDYFDTW